MCDNLLLPEFAASYGKPIAKFDKGLAAESAAREYLSNLPPHAPIKTKAEFFEEIKYINHELYDLCGNEKLSERALERVWSFAPEAWRRPGRRPANRG
jgi:hypothetical protein